VHEQCWVPSHDGEGSEVEAGEAAINSIAVELLKQRTHETGFSLEQQAIEEGLCRLIRNHTPETELYATWEEEEWAGFLEGLEWADEQFEQGVLLKSAACFLRTPSLARVLLPMDIDVFCGDRASEGSPQEFPAVVPDGMKRLSEVDSNQLSDTEIFRNRRGWILECWFSVPSYGFLAERPLTERFRRLARRKLVAPPVLNALIMMAHGYFHRVHSRIRNVLAVATELTHCSASHLRRAANSYGGTAAVNRWLRSYGTVAASLAETEWR